MSSLTLVLRNYARPDSLQKIITALQAQSIKPTIFIWDNSGKPFFANVDWLIKSSRNAHGSAFTYLARQATTPFIGRMDDDLIPTDNKVLADAVKVMEGMTDPTKIVGAYGINMKEGKTYRESSGPSTPDVDIPCDIIKGRLMLFRREVFLDGRLNPTTYHVDVELSIALAGYNRRHHLVSKCFHERITEIKTASVSYQNMATHYTDRDRLSQQWLKSVKEQDD